MVTHVALLRGINVGGHATVRMGPLREALGAAGFDDVATYVQSGNVVLTSHGTGEAVADGVRAVLRGSFDVDAAVVVRTVDELRDVAAANPFATEAAADPTRVHVGFLDAEPADRAALDVDAGAFAPERLAAGDRVRYLHLPAGIGRSRLAAELTRRVERAGLRVTVRNWRTVDRLLGLVDG